MVAVFLDSAMYFATCPQSFLEMKLSNCSLDQSFGSSFRSGLSRAAVSLCDEDSCRDNRKRTNKRMLAERLSQMRVKRSINIMAA